MIEKNIRDFKYLANRSSQSRRYRYKGEFRDNDNSRDR